MADQINVKDCTFSRQDNPLLDGVESLNMADFLRDHPNQREKSETLKGLPRRSEFVGRICRA